MLLWLIVGCEIGFWVILFLGLFVRYILKIVHLSNFILLCVPVIDLTLLGAIALDLHRGSTAEFAHGLAAIYLGFTVVFGHDLITRCDQYISFKIAGGKEPEKAPDSGILHIIYEWKMWLRGVVAGCIAALLIFAAIHYVNHPEQTVELAKWYSYIFWLLVVWGVCWPLWYTVFPIGQSEK